MANAELVEEWFKYADSDLRTAKHLYDTMYPKPLDHICFHCQQSAEKFVKGIMIVLGFNVIKTHDLVLLCTKLKGKVDTDSIEIECGILSQYAVQVRYPQELCTDDAQAKAAIAQAQKVKEWAEDVIHSMRDDENCDTEGAKQ